MDVDTRYTSQTMVIMREVLGTRFGIETRELSLDTPLASLGLDSLGFIEYLFEIEKALNITLPDVPRDLQTVEALVAFIAREAQRQATSAVPT